MATISQVLEGFNIFGRGRDQYTQTKFPTVNLLQQMWKGEEWELGETHKQKLHLYNTTPHLKAVIDRKALMKSNGQWKHYKADKEKGKKEVEKSPYVQRLENPNFLQSGNEYTVQKSIIYSVFGNSIEYLNKGTTKIPRVMWNLPYPDMRMKLTGKMFHQIDIKGVIEMYQRVLEDDKREDFAVDDILHLREPNPTNPLYGLSKIDGLLMPISLIRSDLGFRKRIVDCNGMLGILSSDVSGANNMDPKPLDIDAQKRISKGLGQRYGMQEDKEDILQTEANVKWQAMSYPAKDLLLSEDVVEQFKVIVDTYGLNMNIFSIANQTYENMEHGIRLAYRDTIIPEGENEALAYTKAFGLDGENEWLEQCYDHLDILKTDESEILLRKAGAIEILLRSGLNSVQVSEITGIELGTVKAIEAKPAAF